MSLLLALLVQVTFPTPMATPTPFPEPTPVLRAPAPFLERLVTVGDRTTRLSLFDNRMAVVAVRENNRQVFLRKLLLDQAEYDIYRAAVRRDLEQVTEGPSSALASDFGQGLIRVTLAPGDTRRMSYSLASVPDLATGRLVATLDDLEQRVSEVSPSHEELRHWEPRVGDVVELYGGQRARVSEVREEGFIFLEHQGTALIEVLSPEQRSTRIERVVSRGP